MIRTIRRAAPALAAVGAALTLAADASAVQRFAAPGGLNSGACDTPATACLLSFVTGFGGPLADGDEVVVAPGTYTDTDLELGLSISRAVTIRGADDQPPPTLRLSSFMPAATIRTNAPVTLRRLRIERTGAGGPAIEHNRQDVPLIAEQVTVLAEGAPTAGIASTGPLTLRNALVSARTTNPLAMSAVIVQATSPASVRIVNTTVLASGPNTTGVEFGSLALPTAVLTGTLVNSAVRAGTDVRVTSDSISTTSLTARHSNLRAPTVTGANATFTDGGNNSAGDPLLGADGVPQAGSPLIDAGVTEADIGATDLAGNARSQGPAPDIGAFETPGLLSVGSGAGAAPTPTPASGGGTAGPVASPLLRLTFIKLPRTVRRSVLREGLTVNLNLSGPAAVVAELTGPKRKRLARARVSAKKAGRITMRLKATVPGRKHLAATLKVTATPTGGTAATQSRRLTIR